ncbi:hypothetical protein C0993_001119 [Termitomyces sp. T159_Od127]|nr:hypothetical protein C0993_001119 [Termitomyces sp. T159_Od127]
MRSLGPVLLLLNAPSIAPPLSPSPSPSKSTRLKGKISESGFVLSLPIVTFFVAHVLFLFVVSARTSSSSKRKASSLVAADPVACAPASINADSVLPLLPAFASPSVTPSSPIKLSVPDVIDSVVASPVVGMDITPTRAKSTISRRVASSVIQASAVPFSLIDDQACNADDVAPSDADASSNNADDAAPFDVDASLNRSESPGSVASFVIQDDVVEYVTSSDESMDQHSVHSVDRSHPDVVEVDDSTDPDEVIDYSSLVMQPDIQDPLLTPTYADLPFISEPVELIPYGYDRKLGDEAPPRAHFSAVGSRMCPEDFESLTAAMQFVQYGYYVNLARVDPSVLVQNNRRIALKGCSANLFCGKQYKQHRITIVPFFQEFCRDTSVMALILKVVLPLGGGYGTPKKTDGPKVLCDDMIGAGASPPKRSTKPFIEDSNNSVIDYESIVPVYDGRYKSGSPFRFAPSDFDAINTWPSFCGGRSEVPEGSVVAIGYTTNFFTVGKEPDIAPVITTNVLFVIVLSTPDKRIG